MPSILGIVFKIVVIKKLVLNLIISGMPSIHILNSLSFFFIIVLNLIISGIPSIRKENIFWGKIHKKVLNLIISGMPSILRSCALIKMYKIEF